MLSEEVHILRNLAHQVMEVANQPKYAKRVDLWARHNSLEKAGPLVLVNCGPYAAYEYELIEFECTKADEAVGEIIPVLEDRTIPYIAFQADISYALEAVSGY